MADLKERITELAQLMEEFGLDSAKLEDDSGSVEFSRYGKDTHASAASALPLGDQNGVGPGRPTGRRRPSKEAPKNDAPTGMPISSPMTGIYYTSPSPGTPDFVKEGGLVTAGQVVGLIEAMKVFNEITATTSGTVSKVLATNGQLVQPGDPLLYIA